MEKIELLAPAGGMDSLYAGINKGCDAVYVGGSKFSARASASNFDNDNMIKAVDYAHSYGVKLYVAINTILKESEIEEAVRYAGFLYEIGVDAIIVQDLGLAKRVKEDFPEMQLHASTQMTIHNGEGAMFFKERGFTRIVLSRELSLDEIKYISKDLGIETEIFVHGALCISYSGQCLMSSMIGGRSGNRGKCAQPCRTEFTLKGNNSGERSAHLLSTKETCTIEDMEEIVASGASSLKIEGRMKRAEYVAGVVDNYRKAVDKVLYNKKFDVVEGKRELLQLFNRGGFSNAFLVKDKGIDMMSYNSQKNTGVPLGRVESNGEIVLKDGLCLGDGIGFGEDGCTVSKIIVNGDEVETANRGERAKLFPIRYKKGDELFKSLNKKLFEELEDFTKPYVRKINVNAQITFKIGQPLGILIKYNGKEYEFFGEVVQSAEKRPLDKERIIESMQKVGDTQFKFKKVVFDEYEEGFLKISDLNTLRRDALEGLRKAICKSFRRKRPEKIMAKEINYSTENVEILYQCITKSQLRALVECNCKDITVDLFSRDKEALRAKDVKALFEENKNINIYLKTPTILKSEFNQVVSIIEKIKPYIKGIVTVNVGIINRYKDELYIVGDYKLNIINSNSLKFYQDVIDMPTLSIELNRKEIKAMTKGAKGNIQSVIYGKTELMITEYCPIGSTFGEKTSCKECNIACSKDEFTLVDRMDAKYRVMTDLYCRSYILDETPINTIAEVDDLKSFGVNSFRVEFRDETYEEVKTVVGMVKGEVEIDKKLYTTGLYRRGIE